MASKLIKPPNKTPPSDRVIGELADNDFIS
jgi:hypothetical protein